MSGTRTGRSPSNDQELIRDMEARIRALEQKQTQRVAGWVLGSDTEGRVALTSEDGRSVTLTPDPTPRPPVLTPSADPVFKACRTSTSRITGSTGIFAFPGSWYDTVLALPDYWTWDDAQNGLTVNADMRVLVEMHQEVNPNLTQDEVFANVLMVNGAVVSSGAAAPYSNTTVSGAFQMHDVWLVDVASADVLTPGYFCSNGGILMFGGDAAGITTRFEVTELMPRTYRDVS